MNVVVMKGVILPAVRALLCAVLPLATAQAQEGEVYTYPLESDTGIPAAPVITGPMAPDLLPDNEVFRFETRDKFYDKRKYSDDFRMKGIKISPNVYFGEAKIAGEKGPGIVVEQGDWFWGFNHQGAEILLKF
jgi:hypothetical protein